MVSQSMVRQLASSKVLKLDGWCMSVVETASLARGVMKGERARETRHSPGASGTCTALNDNIRI